MLCDHIEHRQRAYGGARQDVEVLPVQASALCFDVIDDPVETPGGELRQDQLTARVQPARRLSLHKIV